MLSESVEDYLKAIYTLGQHGNPVSTSALAERLNVAPASITQMVKKLDQMEPSLIRYKKHHGATLTNHGERVAVEIIRHHRLIELFLQQSLGMGWDEVDAEAEKLEHVVSEALMDRIADVLGDPKFDPHGAPIPPKGGRMPVVEGLCPLTAMKTDECGTVRRVSDSDPEVLRDIGELGVVPGASLKVIERAPFDGPIHIQLETTTHALGPNVAARVLMEKD